MEEIMQNQIQVFLEILQSYFYLLSILLQFYIFKAWKSKVNGQILYTCTIL